MPGINGLNATRQLKKEIPDINIIILTVFDIQEYREESIAFGASGFVVKESLVEELVPVMRSVL